MSDRSQPPASAVVSRRLGIDATGKSPPVPRVPQPRRPRWRRRIAIFLLLLLIAGGGLVGAAPYLASMPTVSGWLLSQANARLLGTLSVGGLSLSWGGPLEIRGVRVLDPERREVLAADRIACDSGVWRLVRGWDSFGNVTVDAPRAVLYINAANEVSLARAFDLRNPSPPSDEPTTLPQLLGKVLLRGGSVRAVRENGPTYDISDISGDVDLATLGRKLAATLAIKLPDGSQLAAEADVRDLAPAGRLQLADASGTLNIRTTGKIDLGPLAALFAPDAGLSGSLTIDGRMEATPKSLSAEVVADVAKLQTAGRASARAVPVDLSIRGTASRAGDEVGAKADLSGDAGQASVDLAIDCRKPLPELTADRLLAAILEGASLAFPEFRVDARGAIDLVKLQRAVPGILAVRPGLDVTGGKLEIAKVAVRGGQTPAASGSVALRDLTATEGGRVVRLEPIALEFDGSIVTGKGLQITRGELKSSFAEVSARGAASELQAAFRANLSKMVQELGQIFDLSGAELAGTLSGDFQVARTSEERVNVSLQTRGEGLKFGGAGKRLDVQRLNLTHTGFASLKDKEVARYDASSVQADLDGQVVAAGSGWYDFRQDSFQASADIKQADLAFAARRAAALGAADLARYSGVLAGKATAERSARGTPIRTEGTLQARGLGVDGKPLMEGDANLAWSGVWIAGDGSNVTAEAVKLASAAANLDAKGVRFQAGRTLDLSGDMSGSADVQRLFRALAPLTGASKPPDIAGRLGLNARVATANNLVTLSGKGGVDQLEIGTGPQTIREKRLDFDFDGRIDQPAERISIQRCNVTSTPLTAEVTGTIEHYRSSAVLALRGRYDASWDQLTALLHELAPATARTVIVQGRSASAFEIRGPVSQPGARPAFRGVQSAADITWSAAQLYGVGVGAAKLSPTLRDGRLTLPTAAIPAAGGRANLGGAVDFQPADPTLIIAGRLRALENVEVSPEMGRELLSHINPIFMFMSRLEGRVSLDLMDIRAPINEAIKRSGTGRGLLDLGQMRMQPDGILGTLFELGGLPLGGVYPAEMGNVDFTLKDGRIHYDNFTMVFPSGYDLLFYGSVGFDDTVDLIVSLPVTPNLLKRLKIGGPIDLTKQLAKIRIDVPMVGTRKNPRLDFARVNTEKLLKSLLQPALDPRQGIGELLKGVLPGGQSNEPPPEAAPPPPAPPPEKPKKPLLPKKKK